MLGLPRYRKDTELVSGTSSSFPARERRKLLFFILHDKWRTTSKLNLFSQLFHSFQSLVTKPILLTFIVLVQHIQTLFCFNILCLDNFELTYWRRQELNLLQNIKMNDKNTTGCQIKNKAITPIAYKTTPVSYLNNSNALIYLKNNNVPTPNILKQFFFTVENAWNIKLHTGWVFN